MPWERRSAARVASIFSRSRRPQAAKAPSVAKVKQAKPKPKPTDEDEEDDAPIGVTALDMAPRCPNCANEMESEEAVICLTCGYNTRTRIQVETRAVEDTTSMTWFWWLLPGILCALFFAHLPNLRYFVHN